MQSSIIRRTLPQLIFVIAALTVGVFLSATDGVINVSAGTFGGPGTLQASLCNRFPTGTVTTAGGLTSTDTSSGGVSGGWVTNEWTAPNDHNVKMLSGSAIGQTNVVSANTGTTFTVSVAWTPVDRPPLGGTFPTPPGPEDWTAPEVGDRYEIILLPTDPNCVDGAGALGLDSPLDLTTRLFIGATDYNFSAVVTTTPDAAFVAPGPGFTGHVPGTDPDLGDLAGALISDTSLGLTNLACASNLTVDFKFMVATVDNGVANLHFPLQIAQTSNNGTLENMQTDDGGSNGPDDVAGTGDDIAGSVPINGIPVAVERYPSYLNDVFDPDWINNGPDQIEAGAPGDTDGDVNGIIPPVQPKQRLRGGTVVSNSSVELDLMIFEAGVLAAAFAAPHPFNDLTADLGDTTVTVLQNPTATAAPSAITDFCADLGTLTTVWGETRTNPCNAAVIDSGTTTAGTTATVLTDTGGGFTPGALVGRVLQYTSGPAGLQFRTISANTGTTITTSGGAFSPAPTPGGGNGYIVVPLGCGGIGGINTPITGANNLKDRVRTPPLAGTYLYVGYAASLRDTDGDGYENPLDTCVQTPNLDASPRIAAGADSDMIDSACDPTPADDTGCGLITPCPGNHDGDNASNLAQWQNAGDNCPLVANLDQLETELNQSYYDPFATNPAPQGGPKTDGIGDVCDLDVVAEAICTGAVDNDYDTLVNDGCATVVGAAEGPGADCTDNVDDVPVDGLVNDGCVMVGTFSEAGIAGACLDNIDAPDEDPGAPVTDDDATINDGCPVDAAESANQLGSCNDATDADGDTLVNDGCPISTRKATGVYLSVLNVTAKCFGATDGDDDGYCSALFAVPAAQTFDTADGTPATVPEDYDLVFAFGISHSSSGDTPPQRSPMQVCNDGIDNDADTLIDTLDQAVGNSSCRPAALAGHPNFPACGATGCLLDADGDGFTNERERHIGTNALARCGVGAVPSQSNAWPADLVSASGSSDRITLTDLTNFLAGPGGRKLGTTPGDALFDVRWDLVPGSGGGAWIAVDDLTALLAGAGGNPPMNTGGRVFSSAFVCSAHPTYGK